jgi:hypothetical protein
MAIFELSEYSNIMFSGSNLCRLSPIIHSSGVLKYLLFFYYLTFVAATSLTAISLFLESYALTLKKLIWLLLRSLMVALVLLVDFSSLQSPFLYLSTKTLYFFAPVYAFQVSFASLSLDELATSPVIFPEVIGEGDGTGELVGRMLGLLVGLGEGVGVGVTRGLADGVGVGVTRGLADGVGDGVGGTVGGCSPGGLG